MFAALVKYKEKHGHCDVPDKCCENLGFSNWVRTQRRMARMMRLGKERSSRLAAIGFIWEPLDVQWKQMLNLLSEYKDKYGDCDVPSGWPQNRELSSWVGTQRSVRRAGKLDKDRIRCLDRIGFAWDPKTSAWNAMYLALAEYKRMHGHCNVSHVSRENLPLGSWVKTQRKRHKRHERAPAQIELLNKLEFVWDPVEAQFAGMFSELENYKNTYGDTNVPYGWPHNPTLGSWVKRLRQHKKKGLINAERLKCLDAIGFQWTNRLDHSENMLVALKEFKREHGHCNVSQRWRGNPILARWVANQRTRKTRLSKDLVRQLDEIGFIWQAHEVRWHEMFGAMSQYRRINGNCNVPSKWPNDPRLGKWAAHQREFEKTGKLSEDRIRRLNEIGFWRNTF